MRVGVAGQMIGGIYLILHLQLLHIQRTYHTVERYVSGFPGHQADESYAYWVFIAGYVIIDPDLFEIFTCIVGHFDEVMDFVAQTESSLSFGRCIGDALFENKASCRLRDKRLAALIL